MSLLPPLRQQPIAPGGFFSQPWNQWLTSIGNLFPVPLVTGDAKLSFVTPDPNWLQCNGQAVSRTGYAALFTAIGTTYGAGDGSTTFNLPTGPTVQPLQWIRA